MKKLNIKLTDIQLQEACGDLDMGMKIFYNVENGEISAIPDFEEFGASDSD